MSNARDFFCAEDGDSFTIGWSDGRWITIDQDGTVCLGRSPWLPDHPPVRTSFDELVAPVPSSGAPNHG